MSADLKADLLRALDAANFYDSTPCLHSDETNALRARLQAATITEPPPPDPCVVVCGSLSAMRVEGGRFLALQDDEAVTPGRFIVDHAEAAALIPALQEFIGDVREEGQQ